MTDENSIDTSRTRTTASSIVTLKTTPPQLTPLILLTALAVLPVNMILPSLPHIATTFRVDFALVNLAVAGYAIVTALTEIVAGMLSDRYGRRPIALTAICIFIVASAGCALATDIAIFLLFRGLQASIAACFSVALVMIKETSSEGKAASRFGYLAMGWALAPMIGPLLGGSLDALFGWRAIFFVLTMLGAAVLALSMRALKETAAPSSRASRNHLAGYRQLLRSSRFWAYTLCKACSMGTLYVFLGGAPLVAATALGGSMARLGLCMGIVPLGFILGSYLAGRYISRISLSATLIAARIVTCMGLLVGLGLAMLGTTHPLAIFGPCMFIGIGNGLTMPAANTGVLSVRADLAGTAAGLAAAMSIGGGALIVAIAGLFLEGSNTGQAWFIAMLMPATLALLAAAYAAFFDRVR